MLAKGRRPGTVTAFGLNKIYFIYYNNTLTTEQLDRATSKVAYISVALILHKQRQQHRSVYTQQDEHKMKLK